MAAQNGSTSKPKYTYTDRDNDFDASATAGLLSSSDDDQTNRASVENDIPLQNGKPFTASKMGQDSTRNDLPGFLTYDYMRSSPYLRRNWKWLLAVACVLSAIVYLAFLTPPFISRDHANTEASSSKKGAFNHHNAAASALDHSPNDVSASGFSGPRNTFTFLNGTQFVKPPGLKIIGIIFYGRRQFVNVLECYLRRNLKVNGGMLDQVHFLLHTDVDEDVQWIKDLVRSNNMKKHYKLKEEDTSGDWKKWGTFGNLYKKFMTDPDAIYIKLDDDVMFIDDYAVPELIRATLEHPEAHSIQANIINNKWNRWHHLRSNAIWPYLADPNPDEKWSESSWRPSELPRYKGHIPSEDSKFFASYKPPSQGHRWLPLDPTYANLARSPYAHDPRNPMIKSKDYNFGWTLAAQSHFSFFENLERGELTRYSYGSSYNHMWNQWYTRYNINMMAIRGSVVLRKPIWEQEFASISKGDEYLLTQVIPKELGMPVLVATRAIATHYSFRDSRKNVFQTDILDRYRALGNELYCEADNRKDRISSARSPHHMTTAHPIDDAQSEEDEIGDGPQDIFNGNDDYDDDDDDVTNDDDDDDDGNGWP